MTNQDKERAEFEAWFMAVHLLPESDFFKRGDDGRYQYVEIQQSWEALQSINASSSARIAEVKARYEAEGCVFDDQILLAVHAERYSLSMPDSHAKVVMHELAKSTKDNLSRIAELEVEVERLKADRCRIDWLADPGNHAGNVSLPAAIVKKNLSSLRDAIDEAMKGGA